MTKNLKAAMIVFLFVMTIIPFATSEDVALSPTNSVRINMPGQTVAGRVLVDESHTDRASDIWTPANASLFGWLLKEHGYNVSTNWDEALDSGILSGYDVLALFFPQVALTASEITAVSDFVDNGGGLLLVGVDYRESVTAYTPEHLNPISESHGIVFNKDDALERPLKSEGDIQEHFITSNVESFTSDADLLHGCSLEITSPATTLATADGDDLLAVHDTGTGRVVAIGTPAPFLIYNTAGSLLVDNKDHFELSLNIVDWLMQVQSREVSLPSKAIIRVGDGPDLSPAEIEDYGMFVGQYHDHTTYSDGADSPQDMMLSILDSHLDFAVMSDHSYNTPATNGIYGGLAMRDLETKFGLDAHITIGAELSSVPHTVGFPMTENIYSDDTQTIVDGVHAQGGIVSFAHPTIAAAYIPVWENLDTYGYDVFEVDNSGFLHGLGEEAYFRPFIGANDMHSARRVGNVMNAVFVENPSGSDGKITDAELVDAILNRRVVVLDRRNDLVFGEGIWVDRYLSLWDEANSTIQAADVAITQIEDEGTDVSLARQYLENAKKALTSWNPARAKQLAENAISDFLLGIDVTTADTLGVLEPNSAITVTLDVDNRHDYSISLNCTPFVTNSYSLDDSIYTHTTAAGSTNTLTMSGQTVDYGFTKTILNLKNLNQTEGIRPILLELGGLIENISESVELEDEGYEVAIHLLMNTRDTIMISSATLTYDDGSGEESIEMENIGAGYQKILGPYPAGTNVTYSISVTDRYGSTYSMGEYVVEVMGGGAPAPSILTLSVAAIGIIAVVAIIVLFWRKRAS